MSARRELEFRDRPSISPLTTDNEISSDDEYATGRPRKRQRLISGNDQNITHASTDCRGPLSESASNNHLTVFEHSYRIEISDVDVIKSLHKPLESSRVYLLDVLDQEGLQSGKLNIPWLKKSVAFDTSEEANIGVLRCLKESSLVARQEKGINSVGVRAETWLELCGINIILHLKVEWPRTFDPIPGLNIQIRLLLAACCKMPILTNNLDAQTWQVKEFYDNVHVPLRAAQQPLELPLIQCKLYPFQERAVHWLLKREGVMLQCTGKVESLRSEEREMVTPLPLDFQAVIGPRGGTLFLSPSLGVVSDSYEAIYSRYGDCKGGLLCEAMGLGKTVEMIALICAHRYENTPLRAPTRLRSTRATLIITPNTILEQWKDEIREHAPSLKIFHYTGMKKFKKDENVLDVLSDQDVVLTTYSIIAAEIYFAQERPDRTLRNRPRRDLPRSPLVRLQWWRCLLDEAQMVETGVSNAAIVARQIPRINAWAVTGTPLKQNHRDLYGLLLFLKYEPWCSSPKTWDFLISMHRELFRNMIRKIALRHSKEFVKDELRIPSQTRQIITMPFTAIEESHYAQLHYDMQQDCDLDRNGVPTTEDWDPEDPTTIEKMRSWLQRLRQTCLHPEVGGRNRRALNRKDGPLRTVGEVLDVMIEQNNSSLHTAQIACLNAAISQARLYEHARQVNDASVHLDRSSEEILLLVAKYREAIEGEQAKIISSGRKIDDNSDETSNLNVARIRLRSALELQHVCVFFRGNTYYLLKEAEQKKQEGLDSSTRTSTVEALESLENEMYDKAKAVRKELLHETRAKAEEFMHRMKSRTTDQQFVRLPEAHMPNDDSGGIETRRVFEKLYHFCKSLNNQAKTYLDIREQLIKLFCQVLVDSEESSNIELTGDEYEESTKQQDEMYVLVELLRALRADRQDAINGSENLLTKQETKAFLKAAEDGEGPAPELMVKLLVARKAEKINTSEQGSLRGILTETRSIVSSLQYQSTESVRSRAEIHLGEELLKHVQIMLGEQTKSISLLEQEVEVFRDTMNARLAYYKALQKISDTVGLIAAEDTLGQPVDQPRLAVLRKEEDFQRGKLAKALSKARYLENLRNEEIEQHDERICAICQCGFEQGTLTACGHCFCTDCIRAWWSEHRTCPLCKRRLNLNDFHDITYKPAELKTEVDRADDEASIAKPGHMGRDSQGENIKYSIYTAIDPHTLRNIKDVDIRGPSYGSKVDTIVRQILYLRKKDPGSKTIIFSQYRDFLTVLARSLRANDINFSKFDEKDAIPNFKQDPANECFLLAAKAHSAGLNLVCASHVVLAEPLINTAIELQAIARIHRIGQQRQTTVWTYIVSNTVEESVYDISVKRRLAHMDKLEREREKSTSASTSRAISPARTLQKAEDKLEAADSRTLQNTDLSKLFVKGNMGGEMVDKEDLWECLFGNAAKRNAIIDENKITVLENATRIRSGPGRTLLDVAAGTDEEPTVVSRHLRAEAAENRR